MVMATARIPAALAASRPHRESSITTQFSGLIDLCSFLLSNFKASEETFGVGLTLLNLLG